MSPVSNPNGDLSFWPAGFSAWAGECIVPFGQRVLHTPTRDVDFTKDDLSPLVDHMRHVRSERRGIGLAANQVGIPLRMFIHGLPRVAPDVIINPTIVRTQGTVVESEGCLSLTTENSRARVARAKLVTVEAFDLAGARLKISADEYLSRIFQHEIDHLDGHVYVQRLQGQEQKRLYSLMALVGIPVAMIAPLPSTDVRRSGSRKSESR